MHRSGRPRAGRPRPGALGARTLATAAALLLVAVPAHALECPAPAGAAPRLASLPADARIDHLRLRLDANRPSAQAWTWTWGVVDGGLTAAQLAAIPFTSSTANRWALAAGAASSAIGVVQVVAFPIVPEHVPPGDGGCAELAGLEASLDRSADHVELGSGWLAQLGNVAINAAVGVVAGVANGRWQTGAWTFGIGWAIGEAQILTMPTALARDRERYRAGELGGASTAGAGLSATALPRGHGATVSLGIRF